MTVHGRERLSIAAAIALLTLPALSFALLGAHFYRAGWMLWVVVCVLAIGLLALRRRWVPRLAQLALVLGALEWLRTLWVIADYRLAMGQPVLRLAVILGAVAALAVLAALVFESQALRRLYNRDATSSETSP
jgi:hypothetical protein